MKILVINGPNLQLLGKREVNIYGKVTLNDIGTNLKQVVYDQYNNEIILDFYQSNHEGEILDKIADTINNKTDGIIINPAAYTHTSVAILDAIKAVCIPVVEVHISNIHSREEFRSKSITAAACIGLISGFGIHGYELALHALIRILRSKK